MDRERERVTDKWPSRQTRDRAGKASDMSKREQLLGLPVRARELAAAQESAEARNERVNEGKRVTSHARTHPLDVRTVSVAGCLSSPRKQRLASNLRACRTVAMAPRCTL